MQKIEENYNKKKKHHFSKTCYFYTLIKSPVKFRESRVSEISHFVAWVVGEIALFLVIFAIQDGYSSLPWHFDVLYLHTSTTVL